MEIRIDLSTAEIVARAFEVAPEVAREELLAGVTEADALLEREVKEGTPVGVGGGGGLRGSIGSAETVLADSVLGLVSSSAIHAQPVELGSRPHFPPVAPIRDWVEHKLGISQDQSEGVAFAIARTIAKRGTKGHFMFRNAFEANELQVLQILNAAVGRIAVRVGLA